MAYVDMAELGSVLKARRVALGLTQDQIYAAGGPSPPVLSKIENGHEGNYSQMTWAGLSRALGWPSDGIMRLIDGEDPEDYLPAAAVAPDDIAAVAADLRATAEQLKEALGVLSETMKQAVALTERIARGK